MRDLVDEHYPKAEHIESCSTIIGAFSGGAREPSRPPSTGITRSAEFHFTPKHASWLNMVEIEIGVMVTQCLDRRIPDKATLITEIAAWERRRNADEARIKWMFTVDRARDKLGRLYPQPAGRTKIAA
jgi:hypothetical protein